MNAKLWSFEARRCGVAALAIPVFVALAILGTSWMAARSDGPSDMIGLSMLRLVANVLPLTVGLAAVTVISRDRMVELQLSLPTPYATTTARRLGLLLGTAMVSATASMAGIALNGQWSHPSSGLASLLVPLGPTVLLVGSAAWTGMSTRSGIASASLVIAAWMLQLLVLDRLVGIWQANRIVLVFLGALAWLLAIHAISDGDRMLKGESSA